MLIQERLEIIAVPKSLSRQERMGPLPKGRERPQKGQSSVTVVGGQVKCAHSRR